MADLTGALAEVATRVAPVLLFLAAITVVAEIAGYAGVFDVAAGWAARVAGAVGSRVVVLWVLLVVLACASTIVLSLDTTAVLVTPVAIAVARRVRVPELPFAMTTLWLANTASLLLPVSNLTNLLALHTLEKAGVTSSQYVQLAWAPAAAAILATVMLLGVRHRRALTGRFAPSPAPVVRDRLLLVVASIVCLGLGPVFALGITPALPATAAALFLLLLLAFRDRTALARVRLPWLVLLGVAVLFVFIDLVVAPAATPVLEDVIGHGDGATSLLRVAAAGAVSANLVNNLPAYLALEPLASGSAERLMALLVGVNVGPLVTLWASLATLLWRGRCRSLGLQVSAAYVAREGLLCAAVAVPAAVAALALVH